jgi:phage head maturation protease
MGLDTEELKVSSNYTISEYLSCHRTATFAGNGNFYEKPEAKAQRESLHEIILSLFCQVHLLVEPMICKRCQPRQSRHPFSFPLGA